jgi:pimeloyl-ACP methyl ester carboxylesterase
MTIIADHVNDCPIEVGHVEANGITVNVATAGSGPPILLLHGFPHTWQVWSAVIPELARSRRVVAPDLRGMGGTTRAVDGYDAVNLSRDAEALLDALDIDSADVVGIDAGTPPAFVLAMRSPQRVRRLVMMESLLGRLPGAEAFLAGGPPWWFGFHGAVGLPEHVLIGHEADYIDWFLTQGTSADRDIDQGVRDSIVGHYDGEESLRSAFEHYRAMPASGLQIAELVAASELAVPTLAVGAQPVGDALFAQLQAVGGDVTGKTIADCRHIIPLDAPKQLLALLADFLP